jgi:hypothetical protein
MAKKKTFTVEALEDARLQAERLYGRRENFTGADYGPRWKDGKPTGDVVVRVHVRRKLPESALEGDVILPKEINGIPLDVIEGDYRATDPEAGQSLGHRKMLPYLMGGSSCGRAHEGTGTVGMMVQDRDGKWPGILSNWHVMAGARARPGDAIEHPGPADLPAPGTGTPVARLERWMLNRRGDAALARIDPGKPWLPLQLGTFAEIRSTRRVELGEELTKSGRTTGVTTAQVDGIGVYRVTYEVAPGRREPRDIEGFKLVALEPGNPGNAELSSAGDSGSSWSNPETGEGVGLHFAGETNPDPRAEHAIACHLDAVMEELNVEPLTFEALYQPITAGQAGPQAAAEWTPQPDGPDSPWWPWWPWGPHGPHGPRPGPIRDIIRMGGEIPWPLKQYLAYAAWMAGMRNPSGSYGFAPQAETAAPEARPQDREQRLRIIFAHVHAALKSCRPNLPHITIDSKLSEIFYGDLYGGMMEISTCITLHPPMRDIWGPGKGLRGWLSADDIKHCVTFRDVCEVIDTMIGGA